MDELLLGLIPAATLVIGYLLHAWVASYEARRRVSERRLAARELAYGEISAQLVGLFEAYRAVLSNAGLSRPAPSIQFGDYKLSFPRDGENDLKALEAGYRRLRETIFKHSLYLDPAVLHALLDLPFAAPAAHDPGSGSRSAPLAIQVGQEQVDHLWAQAQAILDQMRLELGLEPYPAELRKMWTQ